MGKGERQKKQTTGRRTWRICLILIAVLLVLAVAVIGIVKHYLGRIDRYGDEDTYTMSSEEIRRMEEEIVRQEQEAKAKQTTAAVVTTDDETTPPPTDETISPADETTGSRDIIEVGEAKVIHVLLIGQDRRDNESRSQSDSMILCTINKAANTITMTSFMRDLYVKIPGYQDNRLNAAYPIGGMSLLDRTLEENFGVTVDANVEVDFNEFEDIVDALGGVDIEMTREEVAHLAEFYDYHHLVAGVNHLNGEEALAYSRIRYIDSDFQRTERQRAVLSALIENVRNADLTELFALMETILPLIKTDMTDGTIISYIMKYFPMLSGCEIITQRIPYDDGFEYAEERGMSVIKAFPNLTRRRLQESIGS